MAIWKSKTEGKHRFFAWLLVQRKILTADKLIARNWPCQPVCSLCDQELESADHLCLHCVFAQKVWLLMAHVTNNGLVHVPARRQGVLPRKLGGTRKWQGYRASKSKRELRRRIFNGKSATTSRVVQLIKDEMSVRAAACCRDEAFVAP